MVVPPIISTLKEVKDKLDLLQALEDIDFAMKIIKDDTESTENLIDSKYRRLNCNIRSLPVDHQMYMVNEIIF